jgi:WD40 repeat protein/mono/diheme cytochrome c family protein
MSVRSLLGVAILLALAPSAPAADAPGDKPKEPAVVSYYRDIRPIIQQHCQGCHQPAKPQGDYVMTTYEALFKEGEKGVSEIVPGKPAESLVIDQIVSKGDKPAKMPKKRPSLSPREVTLITKWIEQGAKDDTPISARETIDQEHPPTYPAAPVISAVEYSPDGKLIAVSGYHEVVLHHADGSGVAARLVGLAERVQSIAFSPDGKRLAVSGGSPGRFGEVQIWDLEKNKLKLSVPITFDTLYGISWAPDGSKVAFGCTDNTLRAVSTDTGEQVLFMNTHTDWVLNTTFSQDGEFVASVSRDGSIRLTEVATQRFIDNITSITPGALKGGMRGLARRPQSLKRTVTSPPDPRPLNYEELLIGGSDGVPRLYKMHREVKRVIGDDANRLREFEALPGRIFAARFNSDGSRFVVGSSLDGKGEARIYFVGLPLPNKEILSLAALPMPGYSPLALVAQPQPPALVKLGGEPGPVYAVAFRPDDRQVAVGGFDGMVRQYDALTGKLVKEFVAVPLQKAAK